METGATAAVGEQIPQFLQEAGPLGVRAPQEESEDFRQPRTIPSRLTRTRAKIAPAAARRSAPSP
eukprot:15362858-Alexandrium_andersonii.AAC.1